MTLISENATILLLITIGVITLITFFSFNYQKMKITESDRLQIVASEIEVEKKNSLFLKTTATQVEALEKNTHIYFKTINVNIFNIDFSYKEVLKQL